MYAAPLFRYGDVGEGGVLGITMPGLEVARTLAPCGNTRPPFPGVCAANATCVGEPDMSALCWPGAGTCVLPEARVTAFIAAEAIVQGRGDMLSESDLADDTRGEAEQEPPG